MDKSTPSRTIWILEDSAADQFCYEEMLAPFHKIFFFERMADVRKAALTEKAPDLVILDLNLKDGFLFQEGRLKVDFVAPKIVVSSVDDLEVMRIAYRNGVAHFLVKPFRKNELLAAVDRSLNPGFRLGETLRFERLTLDLTRLAICSEEGETSLTEKETQILRALFVTPVMDKNELFRKIWQGTKVEPKTLDVHLTHLRKKLRNHCAEVSARAGGLIALTLLEQIQGIG